MRLRNVILGTAMLVCPHLAQAGTDPTHGYWLTENGKAIVQFADCGGKTCGKMVWIDAPRDANGQIKRDTRNVDNAKRRRPLCGLTLVGGLDEVKRDTTDQRPKLDGWIYNPRDGETYSVNVQPLSGAQLKVHGYLGLEIFGSSQVWTRVTSDRGGCPH